MEMRRFWEFLRSKLWAIAFAVVGSFMPWVVSMLLKDTFKQTVRAIAGRNEVSSGMYQLLGIAASNPVSACLLLTMIVVCSAALYSAVQAKRSVAVLPVTGAGIEVARPINDLKDAPSILITYVKSPDGRRRLIFSNERSRAALVRKISAITFREIHEAGYKMNIIPTVIQPVEMGVPVRCEVLGARNPDTRTTSPLEDIFRHSTMGGSASLVLDYDDTDGKQFSRQFHLARGSDDSVAFVPDPVVYRGQFKAPVPAAQNLAELHLRLDRAERYPTEHAAAEQYARALEAETKHRQAAEQNSAELLATLKRSIFDLQRSGQLTLLAEEALSLADQFQRILYENSIEQSPVNLSHPVSHAILVLDAANPEVLPWQRLRLMSFRDRYNAHRLRVIDCSLSSFNSDVLKQSPLPIELQWEEMNSVLAQHRRELLKKAEELRTPYVTLIT
jgi:hypothetical protein